MSNPTPSKTAARAAIGFGTYELSGPQCADMVAEAIRLGCRHIDTAQFYQNETAVGEGIRKSGIPREEIFVTTKVKAGIHTTEGCERKLKKSLAELNIGYIDLFLMHGPTMAPERRISSWRNLTEFASRTGSIKACGVSNFGVRHLQELEQAGLPTPTVNQIELHPHLQQSAIVAYCRTSNILIEAYCPLMRGQANAQSLGEGAAWAGKEGYGWDSEGLKGVAEKHGKSIPQVLLRCFTPIFKTSSPSRLSQNLSVHNFNLREEEMRMIDEMNLEGKEEWKGKRIALEWNPVDCP